MPRRKMNEEARQRISNAQKERWAAFHKKQLVQVEVVQGNKTINEPFDSPIDQIWNIVEKWREDITRLDDQVLDFREKLAQLEAERDNLNKNLSIFTQAIAQTQKKQPDSETTDKPQEKVG